MNIDRPEGWLAVGAGTVAALAAALWGQMHWLVQLLIVLGLADTVVATLVAFQERSLSTDTAFRGATKKAVALILVGVSMFVDAQTGGSLPLVEGVAGYYAAREGLSLLRGAERAGLSVPAFLKDRFTQLSPSDQPPRNTP